MKPYTLGPIARTDLAHIYRFTKRRWSTAQADAYTQAMFARFSAIAQGRARSRAVDIEDASVHVRVYEEHFIYWLHLPSGRVGILTILRQHMVQADRVRKAVSVPF